MEEWIHLSHLSFVIPPISRHFAYSGNHTCVLGKLASLYSSLKLHDGGVDTFEPPFLCHSPNLKAFCLFRQSYLWLGYAGFTVLKLEVA